MLVAHVSGPLRLQPELYATECCFEISRDLPVRIGRFTQGLQSQ